MTVTETWVDKSRLRAILIVFSTALLAGVLYVGDTSVDAVFSAAPAIPLALPILIVAIVFLYLGTPRHQFESLAKSIMHPAPIWKWPLASWALLAFIVWISWMMLSSLWAPAEADTTSVNVAFFLLALIGVASAALFYLHPQALAWMWAFIFVFSLVFLYGGITGPRYVGRMTAFGGGPNVFARFMLYGITAAIFFVLWRKYLWFVLLAALPFAYGLVSSGSRGVLGASAIVLLYFMGAVFLYWGWKWALAFYTAAVATLVGIYRVAIAGTQLEEYFLERFILLTFERKHDSGRSELHDAAFEIMREHRLFGAGLHSFEVLSNSELQLEHPHNIFYTVGAEAGIVGIILLVITLFALLLAGRGFSRYLPAGVTLSVAFSVMVAQLVSGYYYDSRPVWLFGFAAVFAILGMRHQMQDKLASIAIEESQSTNDADSITDEGAEVVEAQNEGAVEPELVESTTNTDVSEEVAETALEVDVPPAPEVEVPPVPEPVAAPAPAPEPELVVVPQPTSRSQQPAITPQTVKVAGLAVLAVAGISAIGLRRKHRQNREIDARARQWLRELSEYR